MSSRADVSLSLLSFLLEARLAVVALGVGIFRGHTPVSSLLVQKSMELKESESIMYNQDGISG